MINFNMARKKTVCFTGHREMNEPAEDIERRVAETVERLIQEGYKYFEAGGARGFDALASEVVLKLKEKYPHIRLILVLPFERQYRHEGDWSDGEMEQYHDLIHRASKVTVLESGYSSGVYYRRNRYLVDNASVCVAYMTRTRSGTGYTVRLARDKGLAVFNTAL